jgi:hypothetical protein
VLENGNGLGSDWADNELEAQPFIEGPRPIQVVHSNAYVRDACDY